MSSVSAQATGRKLGWVREAAGDRFGQLGLGVLVFAVEPRAGRGNAGIAAHLHLSESSVGRHVNAIFTKLGLTTADLSRRRVTAVLTFLRDAGLRGG